MVLMEEAMLCSSFRMKFGAVYAIVLCATCVTQSQEAHVATGYLVGGLVLMLFGAALLHIWTTDSTPARAIVPVAPD